MKRSTRFGSVLVVVSVLALGLAGQANASLFWDTAQSAGSWIDDGTTLNWGAGTGGPYDQVWASASDAHFEGTAGAVTVDASGIASVNSITFDVDGYTLSGGPITMTGAGGNVTTGAGSDTISSVIAGSVGLTKAGAGTLTLTGANTYTGGTTLTAGTLKLQNATALGDAAGALTITGGNLDSGTANLVISTNNAQNWNGDFGFTGTQNLNLGTGTVTMSAARTVTVAANTLTVGGVIGGTGLNALDITKAGDGTLLLTGAVTMSGSQAATVNAGEMRINGIIDDGGNTYTLTKSGGGKLTLAGANTFSGGVKLEAGTLQIDGQNAALGTGTLDIGATTGTTAVTLNALTARAITNPININQDFTYTGTNTLTQGTGAVTLTGGNRTITVAASTLTLGGAIGDGGNNYGLTKTGAGTLVLSGANTFNGGVVINAGALTISSDTNLGAAGGGITFNGSPTLFCAGTIAATRTITLNSGANPTFDVNSVTIAGPVTGSGGFTAYKAGQGNPALTLSSTTNTFTGPMNLRDKGASGTGSYTFNSLADVSGAGNIKFSYTANGADFVWGTGAIAPLVLNYRQFDLAGTKGPVIKNNNTASFNANVIIINTDLLVSAAGAKTLTLGGTNAGANTFAGKIADGTGAVISVAATSSYWTLSGTNTYSGTTSPDNVTLTLRGKQAVSPNTTFSFDPTSGSGGGGGGKLNLYMDDAGTVSLGNQVNVRSAQTSAAAQWTILVGNNGGGTTGSTIALGKMNFASVTDSRAATITMNVQGANGYRLQFSDVDLNVIQVGAQRFNPTTAPLTITGTVKQVNGKTAANSWGADYFGLDGTATGNLVSGTIKDALDYTSGSNPNARPLNVTKSNTSQWSLSGSNTYTGATRTTGGTLIVNSLTNGGVASSIGQSTSATANLVLGGGTLQYAPISGVGGAGDSTDRNFAIVASSTLDASGTGALVFNAPTGNIVSPDVGAGLGGTWATGQKVITGLTSTANLAVGMRVSGTGIVGGQTIASINSATQVTLSANTTAAGSGDIAFGYGARTLTLAGTNTGANTIAGRLQDSSATGAYALSLTKSGTGTWVLSGANTYTGATTVSDGTLEIGGAGQLGSGNYAGAIAIAAGKTFKYNSSAAQTLSGIIGTTGIAGVLVKDGLGTLTLTNANIYTGGTTVSAGTLLVNNTTGSGTGTGTVNVGINGTLGGTGAVSGPVILAGILAPGNSIESIDTGALTIAATGTLDNELGRDGENPVSDLVNVTGSVTLESGANLKLTLGEGLGNPVLDDIYYLVSNDSADAVSGVFTKLNGIDTTLAEGSQFTWNTQQWQITYKANATSEFTGGNDIALKVIPEPATLALLALGGLGLLVRRRRRA